MQREREWLLNVRNMVLLCGSVALIVGGATLLLANVVTDRNISTLIAPTLLTVCGAAQLLSILRNTRIQRQVI